jgi:Cu+-exporting ATPase
MNSEHPIARAITNAARSHLGLGVDGTLDGSVGDFVSTVGKGISASVEAAISPSRTRYAVLIGNSSFLRSHGVALPFAPDDEENPFVASTTDASSSKVQNAGTTTIHTAINNIYTGTLSLSDILKPSAPAAIRALQKMNIACSIVTGDQASTAQHVASLLSIPASNVHSSILPSGKREIIEQLQASGEIVAMVGDGINDSPALATANVGISLASGTDVAIEAADIVLMRPDNLLDIPASLQLSRSIFTRIKVNLVWACIYNAVGLPVAMGFLLPWGISLPPMAAGAAMACSSVTVVVSSLLLKRWRRPRWMQDEEGVSDKDELAIGDGRASRGGFVSRIVGRVNGWRRGKKDQESRGSDVPLQRFEEV